jgi:hypothetical protein
MGGFQDMLWLRAVGLAAAALIGFVVGTTQLTDIGDSSASARPSMWRMLRRGEPQRPSWQPRRRLLAIALSISLVANLFLGGLTLGWMLHLNLWPWQSSYVTEFGSQAGRAIEHLVRNLDSADRDLVVDTIRSHRDELSNLRQGHARAARQGEGAARAPVFDRQAAEAASAEMRRLGDEMQAALGKAILEAVEKLPPEARRHMAD